MRKISFALLMLMLAAAVYAEEVKPLIAVPVFENHTRGAADNTNGERSLGERAGMTASDEMAAVLLKSNNFNLLDHSKLVLPTREEGHKQTHSNESESYIKLCQNLNAQYLVLGVINSFHVNILGGGDDVGGARLLTARIKLELRVIHVVTGEALYEGYPERSISTPIPAGAEISEAFDWEAVLRQAVSESADRIESALVEMI